MDYTKHLTTARYSEDLKKIVNAYGVAGYGFYWMAIEMMLFSQEPIPMINLQKNGYKRLSRTEAERIILDSELFNVDELNRVTLNKNKKDIDFGIDNKSLETYFSKLAFCSGEVSRAVAGAVAGAVTSAVTGAVTGAGAVPFEIEKDNKRKSINNKERETLLIFMEERCPHLLEMAEPLTLQQFRELKKSYSEDQVKEVLLDMENDVGLSNRRRSCYQTSLTWLTKRFGPPQSGNKNKGKAVFCGLDENGSPIYKQLKNNKNGKQDSNSAVCPADAEQQGNGSGSAEWLDE